ncbi:MAG: ABC transporter permease [Candidatus Sulfotelmatobacter sp.]
MPRTSACWLAFALATCTRSTTQRLRLPPAAASVLALRAAKGKKILRPGVDLTLHSPLSFACVTLLVALFSACGGLALGCSINQTHIGLMFSMVLTPMIFFGCTYYPWSALDHFPILQKIVLINPLVYTSEGLRGTLVPQFTHLPLPAVLIALTIFDVGFLAAGLRQFRRKPLVRLLNC